MALMSFDSIPKVVGSYEINHGILDGYLEAIEPKAWVVNEAGLSVVYVSAKSGLTEFELEELDDRIYNNLIRRAA